MIPPFRAGLAMGFTLSRVTADGIGVYAAKKALGLHVRLVHYYHPLFFLPLSLSLSPTRAQPKDHGKLPVNLTTKTAAHPLVQ